MANTSKVSTLLVKKYNRPIPRYTSYPTVPCWNDMIDKDAWKNSFKDQFNIQNSKNGISIYIHLPFCESLCTYCGCNKKITKNHSVENEYLQAIEKEWLLYRKLMKETPIIREIHLGGGTPTFFSPANLGYLLQLILKKSIIHPRHEFSIEGHPNNTTEAHLKLLYSLGFRRISYGVQDLDPMVQHVINRIQPFENVKQATEAARKIGFTSVNFDLIYGLPLQSLKTIENTINQVLTLRPDRIAFYSYAHVPWTSRGQRLFNETDLPDATGKIALYLAGKKLLTDNGYEDVGMDHFSLPHDDLYISKKNGNLHRNFMGYTTQNSDFLVGLGVSSISDIGTAYAQNRKSLHEYYEDVNNGELSVSKGYFMTEEDKAFGKYIKEIACKGYTLFDPAHLETLQDLTFPALKELSIDGLVNFNTEGLKLTAQGHYFIRNVCSTFDLYLQRNREQSRPQTFSQAI